MKTAEVFNLSTLGIDPKFFKFNVTHMESEKYISVRDVDAVSPSPNPERCRPAHHHRPAEEHERQSQAQQQGRGTPHAHHPEYCGA